MPARKERRNTGGGLGWGSWEHAEPTPSNFPQPIRNHIESLLEESDNCDNELMGHSDTWTFMNGMEGKPTTDIILLLWVTPDSCRVSGFFFLWASGPHPGPKLSESLKNGPRVETKAFTNTHAAEPSGRLYWLGPKFNPESCLPASTSSPGWL